MLIYLYVAMAPMGKIKNIVFMNNFLMNKLYEKASQIETILKLYKEMRLSDSPFVL